MQALPTEGMSPERASGACLCGPDAQARPGACALASLTEGMSPERASGAYLFGPDAQALPGACALALLKEEMSLGEHLAHTCLAQTRRHCLERVHWTY